MSLNICLCEISFPNQFKSSAHWHGRNVLIAVVIQIETRHKCEKMSSHQMFNVWICWIHFSHSLSLSHSLSSTHSLTHLNTTLIDGRCETLSVPWSQLLLLPTTLNETKIKTTRIRRQWRRNYSWTDSRAHIHPVCQSASTTFEFWCHTHIHTPRSIMYTKTELNESICVSPQLNCFYIFFYSSLNKLLFRSIQFTAFVDCE